MTPTAPLGKWHFSFHIWRMNNTQTTRLMDKKLLLQLRDTWLELRQEQVIDMMYGDTKIQSSISGMLTQR
jgi:hypothetical protein